MAYSKTPALLGSKKEYVRHFGGFRGVDFSSEHTDVLENRFAYAVNVYKDYQSGQGTAVETIPGFRRRVNLDNKDPVLGIHNTLDDKVFLVHQNKRYSEVRLDGGNYTATLSGKTLVIAPGSEKYQYKITIADLSTDRIVGHTITVPSKGLWPRYETVRIQRGSDGNAYILLPPYAGYDFGEEGTTVNVQIPYGNEIEPTEENPFEVGEIPSKTFIINNYVWIVDGKNLLRYMMGANDPSGVTTGSISTASSLAYVPTTYSQIASDLEQLGYTEGYEQHNLLGSSAKNVFYVEFKEGETSVTLYPRSKGTSVLISGPNGGLTLNENYTVVNTGGYISSITITKKDENDKLVVNGTYTLTLDGVAVYISVGNEKIEGKYAINGCTVGAIYDGRLFLSGHPKLPNHVFWCGINQETNLPDPTYWGEYDFVQDGVGSAKVKAMIPVANALMVLKEESKFEGSVYYHSPMSTGTQIAPVTYPPTQGLYGTGCLGAATNFLDDPVFISRLGLEGIGTLSVRLERAVEHRSSLVDAKLVTQKGLKDAEMVEWNGYLCILVDGNIFMADSRQRYTDSNGIMQYEWYYLEGIGVWEDEAEGRKFYPACCLTATTDNLFFGTTNGVICSFNFDMRDDNGEIPPTYYDFDGEAIYSAVATKMDNCGIPHLTKSTVKKSVVIKTRTLVRSAAKVKVRTTKSAYEQIGRIASSRFDFNNVDFEDLSFETSDTTVFALTEKTKRWMEKQYVIYSDELHKPLSINYIAYRYTVAGRYKE